MAILIGLGSCWKSLNKHFPLIPVTLGVLTSFLKIYLAIPFVRELNYRQIYI